MQTQTVSLISTVVNMGLGAGKVFFGLLTGSLALTADGIDSSLDVISSFLTFLGLKIAKKPVDEKHPYGYYKAESLAGFIVTLFLFASGVLIIVESIRRVFSGEETTFSVGAVVVTLASALITEVLARLKFHYGRKEKSLALVADAQHSRADVLSTFGVFAGLFLSRYLSLADSIISFIIGGYILFQGAETGKEITDSLLDVSNPKIEQEIKDILAEQNIKLSGLKTRRIGSHNFAELKIKLPPRLKIGRVNEITDALEQALLNKIEDLKYVVISIEAYDLERKTVRPGFGWGRGGTGRHKALDKIGPDKKGERTAIPLEKGELSSRFGAEHYLIVDKKGEEVLLKKQVKNPYYEQGGKHGLRFIKAVQADRVVARTVGAGARENLESLGIEVKLVQPDNNLEQILKEL